MPTAGPCAVNEYVKVLPGRIGSWVMYGTPSMALGTSMPCQWTVVDCGSSFLTTMETLSPSLTLITGPGTWPLYVHALTVLPGSTCQSTIFAVRSNCFVPSGSTVGG